MTIKKASIILTLSLAVVLITSLVFDRTQSFYKTFSKGKKHFIRQEYAQSLPYFAAAFNMHPTEPEALHYLVSAYEKTGNNKELFSLLGAAAKNRPEDPGFQETIADTYYSLKDYAGAESLYRQALKKRDTYGLKRKLVEVLIWQGKYEEGISMLGDLVKERPKDLSLFELLADANSWAKNYGQAITLYNELLAKKFHARAVTLKIADALRLSGNNAEAVKFYKIYLGY